MRPRFRACLLLLALLLPVLAQAQVYRWVDDKGKVHYSDLAPSSGARNVQKQTMTAAQGSSGLPYALQQAVRNFPVTLYTAESCKEICAQARELLNKRGVPYSEVSVADAADLAQLKQLSGGTAVPVMTVGREVVKGYERGTYDAALAAAGYPASSMLPPGVQARRAVAKPVQVAAPRTAEAEGKRATAPQESAEPVAPK